MRVILSNDHGGLAVREAIFSALGSLGAQVYDMGVTSENSVDYPDRAAAAARKYLRGGYDFGILICGTGIGISIAANKIDGIRCALVYDSFSSRLAREHNNANFIALGGRMHYHESVEDIIKAYATAKFEGGRHVCRVEKIHELEKYGPHEFQ